MPARKKSKGGAMEGIGLMITTVKRQARVPEPLHDDLLQNWILARLEGKGFWEAYHHAVNTTLVQYRNSPLLQDLPAFMPPSSEEDEENSSEAAIFAKSLIGYVARSSLPKERALILSALDAVKRGERISERDLRQLREIFERAIAALMKA